MKFAAFFMAEYANMITVTAMATLLFLGGWHAALPGGIRLVAACQCCFSSAAGIVSLYPRAESGAAAGPHHASRCSASSSSVIAAGCSLLPMLQTWLLPLFWFCGQDGLSAVRLYLDPRHAAALPLRPVDGASPGSSCSRSRC